MNNLITDFGYTVDKGLLLSIVDNERKTSSVYHNSMENWRWSNNVKHPYFETLMRDLKVRGWVDFYFQEANSFLLPHRDPKSISAINFVLSPEPAPITFYPNAVDRNNLGEAVDYTYTTAIINPTVYHSVQTGATERILFKICIASESYEDLVKRLLPHG
jgi:hypothetical protein